MNSRTTWNAMTAVERTLLVGRRRELWKARYPELRRGFHGNGRGKTFEHQEPFFEQECKRLGVSQKTLKSYLALYTKVGEPNLLKLFNTALDTYRGLERVRRTTSKDARARLINSFAKPLRRQRTLEIRT